MTYEKYRDHDAETIQLSWAIKLIVLAGGPAVGTAFSGISAALPQIETNLASTPADKYLIKMLVGIVGAAMVIGAPLTGFVVDRIGLKRIVVFNYAMIAAAGSAGMYIDNLPVLIATRFILGLAAAGAVTSSIVMINQIFPPDRRAHWMGGYIAASFIGAIVLQPLAGILAESNWHNTFAIYLLAAPVAAIALFASTSVVEGRNIVCTEEKITPRAPDVSWFPLDLAGFGFIMGCISYLPIIYVPFLLHDIGIGPKLTSYALLGDTLTGACAALIFGTSRRYLTSDRAFVFSLLATATGGFVTALASTYVGVMIGLGIIGLGTGWFMPNLMEALGYRVTPHQQGRAAGLVKGINYLSTPICVVAVEGISQIYGPRSPILISAVLSLALLMAVAWRTRTGAAAG